MQLEAKALLSFALESLRRRRFGNPCGAEELSWPGNGVGTDLGARPVLICDIRAIPGLM
jgi:hypothetical protein